MPRNKKPPLYPPSQADNPPVVPMKPAREKRTARKAASIVIPDKVDAHLAVKTVFVTDPQRPSIPELLQRPEFAHLSQHSVSIWCKNEDWVGLRREFQDAIFERAKVQIGRKMTRDYVAICETLRDMYFSGLRKMLGEDPNFAIPEARSYEGMIRALAFVASKYAEMAKDVIDTTTPQLAAPQENKTEGANTNVAVRLTAEENRAAVAAVLRLRVAAANPGSVEDHARETLAKADEAKKT